MAIIYQDDFETGTLAGNGWTAAGGAALSVGTGTGGSKSVEVLATNSNIYRTATPGTTFSVFLSLNNVDIPDVGNLLGFHLQNTGDGSVFQIGVYIRYDLIVGLLRNLTEIAVSASPVIQGYKRIILRVFIDAVVGTATVTVDGVTVIDFTGNTKGGGSVGADFTALGHLYNNGLATKHRYDNFAIGNSLTDADPFFPGITTTSPLPSATVGVAYTKTLAASGGTGPYTWAITSGALPAGLSLAGATGIISGTPTIHDVASSTIQVTDANGHTGAKAFSLFVGDAACVPSKINRLIKGQWTHNSRVGVFENEGPKLAAILRDYLDSKKLLANYSVDYGFSWTEVRTAALPSAIVSHDCHQLSPTVFGSIVIPGETIVHIATQESTGRVAYHIFNLETGTFTTENEVVVASANIIDGVVSIAKRVPRSSPTYVLGAADDVVIAYETDKELVSGNYYERVAFKRRVSGVWTSETIIGDVGAEQNNVLGRVMPGIEARMHFFMSVSPGYFVPSTQDLQVQTLREDNTLSTIVIWRYTGLSGQTAHFSIGGYGYVLGQLAVCIKDGGGPIMYLFVDDDTLAIPFKSFSLVDFLAEDPFNAQFPMLFTRFLNNRFHFLWWRWEGLFSNTEIMYGTFFPDGTDWDSGPWQAGPTMNPISVVSQDLGGHIAARIAKEYAATLVGVGSLTGRGNDNVKFEWIDTALLPSDSSITLAAWIAALDSQVVTFDCLPGPPVITSPCPLPDAVLGVPYSYVFTAVGGSGAFTWQITAGVLPPGLTMSTAGVISGTPLIAEAVQITVKATSV